MLNSYVVILNPEARSVGDAVGLLEAINRLPSVQVRETGAPGEARQQAREAAGKGVDCVVAVGGDGTLNEVLNGLLEVPEPPALGLIPLGTGNDFARTVGIPVEPEAAIAVLTAGRTAVVDVIRLHSQAGARWALNTVTGGFSTTVDERLTAETKEFFGRLSFLVTAGNALPELQAYDMRLELDGELHEMEAYTLGIINGRTTAGGIMLDPEGCLNDGHVRVVVVPAVPLGRFAAQLPRLLRGELDEVPDLLVRKIRKMTLSSTPAFRITVDGELGGCTPVELEVVPKAVRFVVGDPPEGVLLEPAT